MSAQLEPGASVVSLIINFLFSKSLNLLKASGLSFFDSSAVVVVDVDVAVASVVSDVALVVIVILVEMSVVSFGAA